MVRDGYIYGGSLVVVAALIAWTTGSLIWAFPALVLAVFFLWFFRDPERQIPAGNGMIVSPGDGRVTETVDISTPAGPRQRISIFLSVFDVHVNRSPIAGILTSVRYQKGQYLNAMNPVVCGPQRAEHRDGAGRGMRGDVQADCRVAGATHRVQFWRGQPVERGQRVGLIKFGSRVDVVVPAEALVQVKVGERVQGGASVIALMPDAVPDLLQSMAAEPAAVMAEGARA